MNKDSTEKKKGSNNVLWSFLSIGIAAATVWAVISQSGGFSTEQFISDLKQASIPLLAAAVLSMFGFIYFEGVSLIRICEAFLYPRSRRRGFVYAAADIYFSAITPSATGGQPASAFFMMKDEIPGLIVTIALIVNLTMYTIAVLVMGIFCFVLRPNLFFQFSILSRLLILVGSLIMIGLTLFFYMLLKRERLLHIICDFFLHLMTRLHLIHHEDKLQQKLLDAMDDYKRYAAMLAGQQKMLVKAFFLNLFQRMSQLAVTLFSYLALGGSLSHAIDIWMIQSYVVLGSNCAPIPGAMGVADYLMVDGFGIFMTEESAASLELLSRSVSFYSCIIICGIAILINYILLKFRRKSL